jgi:hypothetical protein
MYIHSTKKMCSMISFLFQLCDVNSSTLEEWYIYIYHVDYGILSSSVVWCKTPLHRRSGNT